MSDEDFSKEVAAVVRIQSFVRGWKARKLYMQMLMEEVEAMEAKKMESFEEANKIIEKEHEEEIRKLEKMLTRSKSMALEHTQVEIAAATKIQSLFRGYIARKNYQLHKSELINGKIRRMNSAIKSVAPNLVSQKSEDFDVHVVAKAINLNEEINEIPDGGICSLCGESFSFSGLKFCKDCSMFQCRLCESIHHKSKPSHVLITADPVSYTHHVKNISRDFLTSSIVNDNQSETSRSQIQPSFKTSTGDFTTTPCKNCEYCTKRRAVLTCPKCQLKFCTTCDIRQHVDNFESHKRIPILDNDEFALQSTLRVKNSSVCGDVVPPSRISSYVADGLRVTYLKPSVASLDILPAPTVQFFPDQLFGFSGYPRVFSTISGDVVYSVGRMVVQQHPQSMQQKFFNGHSSEITALNIHPNRKIIASAQKSVSSDSAFICIWEVTTMSLVAELHEHTFVSALAFNSDGTRLCSIGNIVVLWDWCNKSILQTLEINDIVSSVRSHSVYPNVFLVCSDVASLLKVEKSGISICSLPKCDSGVTCACFLPDSEIRILVAIGTEEGDIYIVDESSVVKKFAAHSTRICDLNYLRNVLVSIDNSKICSWSSNYSLFASTELPLLHTNSDSELSELDVCYTLEPGGSNTCVIGGSSLFLADVNTTISVELLNWGGDCSCVAVYGNKIFVGVKNVVVIFDGLKQTRIFYPSCISALSCSQTGVLAVGLTTTVYFLTQADVLNGKRGRQSPGLAENLDIITGLKFSASYLAVLCEESLQVFDNLGSKLFSFDIPRLKTVDFSHDEKLLMTSNDDLEIIYLDLTAGLVLPSNLIAIANAKWSTWTSPVGSLLSEYSEIPSCCARIACVSPDCNIKMSGDNQMVEYLASCINGKLYMNPLNQSKSRGVEIGEAVSICSGPLNTILILVDKVVWSYKFQAKNMQKTLSTARVDENENHKANVANFKIEKNDSVNSCVSDVLKSIQPIATSRDIVATKKDELQRTVNSSQLNSARSTLSYSKLVQLAKKSASLKKSKSNSNILFPKTAKDILAEMSSIRSQIAELAKDKTAWKTKLLRAQQTFKNCLKDEILLSKSKSAIKVVSEFDEDPKSSRSITSASRPIITADILKRLSQDPPNCEFIEQFHTLKKINDTLNSKLVVVKSEFQKLTGSQSVIESPNVSESELKAYREQKINLGKQWTEEKTRMALLTFQQEKYEQELIILHQETKDNVAQKENQLNRMKEELLALRSDCTALEDLYSTLKFNLNQ